ncbi:16S rRNA processing protein RimM [Lachnospiraceae bacterium]|nr:16S rRNA processing protein RimM [Lachnospiraceae bacterium]
MFSDGYVSAGTITSTHGIRGEVKVYPTVDDPDRFSSFGKVLLSNGKTEVEAEIEKVKYFKNLVIVKFRGIDDINDVMKYRRWNILVTREDAADLQEGQYFEVDILGLRVITDDDREIGKITEILHTGANDVYTVKGESGKEILIPAIQQCILDVDLENGIMKVHLLNGME